MGKIMREELEYLELCERIMEQGIATTDRTGVGTISLFGMQQRYNLSQGFPAVTN